jgi:hypothetical protein
VRERQGESPPTHPLHTSRIISRVTYGAAESSAARTIEASQGAHVIYWFSVIAAKLTRNPLNSFGVSVSLCLPPLGVPLGRRVRDGTPSAGTGWGGLAPGRPAVGRASRRGEGLSLSRSLGRPRGLARTVARAVRRPDRTQRKRWVPPHRTAGTQPQGWVCSGNPQRRGRIILAAMRLTVRWRTQ